jgi:hypothetical protein
VTTWSEIVTTALLGTGRRPVPDELPAWAEAGGLTPRSRSAQHGDAEGRVLDLAAAHRVAAQAGRVPQTSGSGPAGATAVPAQRLALAPAAAGWMLDAFLSRPDGPAINLWLAACVRHGYGLAPEHWAPVIGLASRSTTYDRSALAETLGERGRWFAHQNPDWQRLATALDKAVLDRAANARPDSVEGSAVDRHPTAEQVESDPELLLRLPDPWPDTLLGPALVGLVNGRMGDQSRPFARRVGRRLTEAQYASLPAWASQFLELPHLVPAARRAVRSLFVEIERSASDAVEIERAFDPSRPSTPRVSIPPV